jgi:signal transduction histidine kinase
MAATRYAFQGRLARHGVAVIAVSYAVAAIVAVPRSSSLLTTYAGASPAAHAGDLAAGLGLIGAGLLAWFEPRSRRLGLLALLAGVTWFGPDWEGWDGGPTLIRGLGAVAAPFFLAFVFHLVLTFPSGHSRTWPARTLVGAAYGIAAVVAVGLALFRDPFLDPYCWRNCLDNSFLIHADQATAQALTDVWFRSALAAGLVLVIIPAWRLVGASGPARRALWPILVAGLLVGASTAAYGAALIDSGFEDHTSGEFSAIFLARSLSATALALAVAWSVLRARRTRRNVSTLAAELGEAPPPGKLREALAAAVGDPNLEVLYWLPTSRSFVDSSGTSVDRPDPGVGRAITPIVRAGRQVALVVHDVGRLDGPVLEQEIGAAAKLAVDNERLQAEVLAQLKDLRASRGRIIEQGDAERRRLERNLHDGAQQRLLALSYDLRLAQTAARKDGVAPLPGILDSAASETQTALEELRDLANGIFPAILTEAGLAPALEALADTAPIPIQLGELPRERYPDTVETTAYLTVVEAIEDAAARNATLATATLVQLDNQLIVTVTDDGTARKSKLVYLADRTGALGGSLETGPTTLQAEIPCA